MTTGSTASSGTDPQDPGEPTEAPEAREQTADDEVVHDPARRAFFLQFGRQAATAVGQVAGMADVVGRTSSALAGELLGLEEPQAKAEQPLFVRSSAVSDPVVSAAAPAAENAFRSAYRLSDEGLVILDQRRIPEALEEVVAKRGSDVAYYLRLGVARGGALMAQLAAYGLALTAAERAEQPAEQRALELRRSGRALIESRPSSRLLTWAVDRMHAATVELDASTPGSEVAEMLRTHADGIAAEVTAWEAALAAQLRTSLPRPEGRPLTLLLHGGQGPLIAGQLGAGLSALVGLREGGRELRVFVAEGRPFMDGGRLLSWELRQAGIEHKVIPDAAAAWLFEREVVDAVLVRAEWVAANRDTGALIGARALALLAAAHTSAGADGPNVVVVAPPAAVDEETADGAAIPAELRPARELAAYLSDTPVRTSDALVPAADVIPAALIDALVTEQEPST